jgi:hypothetical protein
VDWQRLMPPRGFRVLPRRWVVERTFAWITHNRRMSKDYERLCATSEAFIYVAMTRLMVRRLARAKQFSDTISSARSGDIFGNGQMLVVRTPKDCADPIGQLVGPQQAVGLDHLALAVDPSGLHRIEPRTLLG